MTIQKRPHRFTRTDVPQRGARIGAASDEVIAVCVKVHALWKRQTVTRMQILL